MSAVWFLGSGGSTAYFCTSSTSQLGVRGYNQPAAPLAEMLIVPKNSNLQSVQDLKGKRIALNKGSNVHYLLLKVLQAHQLKLEDIHVVYLPPAERPRCI